MSTIPGRLTRVEGPGVAFDGRFMVERELGGRCAEEIEGDVD